MSPQSKKAKVEDIAVTRFREYLRIKTVQPTPDYAGCTAFLTKYAKELNLECKVVELVKGKPLVIMTWKGTDPSQKSLILNSHTDVVPVSEEHWDNPPFEAVKLDNGDIVARGAQDMKCVGIWYMEAIRKLQQQNKKLKRTLHLTWVPDEEIGGHDGMMVFVKSKEFKELNAGFALDEGLANEKNAFKLYYGERSPWWLTLIAKGNAGHGSKFIEPSATYRLLKTLDKFLAFRDSEQKRLEFELSHDGKPITLGDVTTTNVTILKAGVQHNVVHEEAQAGVDIRIAPTVNHKEFEQMVKEWCAEYDVEMKTVQKFDGAPSTILSEHKEWQVVQSVAKKHKVDIEPEIFPAATDSRFLRQIGVPAFGISAIKNTPVLLHDHNEYLNENVFLEGVSFYVDLISGMANL
ncbi:adenylate cyclase [Boothiomyces macroporosus]|uniref:Adenylate cyclase n=1 Tax=Boothiomyces macroporosus TaxID=261099 RepID=A0AAD5UDP4_9FUNG|nr:adenylate cyclase [Boothiomyces macroporosus]